jgi:hypothetical protein
MYFDSLNKNRFYAIRDISIKGDRRIDQRYLKKSRALQYLIRCPLVVMWLSLTLSLFEDFLRILSHSCFEFSQTNPVKSTKGQRWNNASCQPFRNDKSISKAVLQSETYKILKTSIGSFWGVFTGKEYAEEWSCA